jgi:hypothetical protein
VLPWVLLDDGQGKSTTDMDIISSESEEGQHMDGRLESATMGPPGHANAIGEEHILLHQKEHHAPYYLQMVLYGAYLLLNGT